MLTHIHGSIELINRAQAFNHSSRCRTCPVAAAIKQVLKPQYEVLVTSMDIVILDGDSGAWLHTYGVGGNESELPPGHFNRVTAFDSPNRHTQVYNEFDFDMDIPQEYLR